MATKRLRIRPIVAAGARASSCKASGASTAGAGASSVPETTRVSSASVARTS